jgi:hypothetical protein
MAMAVPPRQATLRRSLVIPSSCRVQLTPSGLVSTAPSRPTATNRAPSQATSSRSEVTGDGAASQCSWSVLVRIVPSAPTTTRRDPFQAIPLRSTGGSSRFRLRRGGVLPNATRPPLPTAAMTSPASTASL